MVLHHLYGLACCDHGPGSSKPTWI